MSVDSLALLVPLIVSFFYFIIYSIILSVWVLFGLLKQCWTKQLGPVSVMKSPVLVLVLLALLLHQASTTEQLSRPIPLKTLISARSTKSDSIKETDNQVSMRTSPRIKIKADSTGSCDESSCTVEFQKEFTMKNEWGAGARFTVTGNNLKEAEMDLKVVEMTTTTTLEFMYYSLEVYNIWDWVMWNAEEDRFHRCDNQQNDLELPRFVTNENWKCPREHCFQFIRQTWYQASRKNMCNSPASANDDVFCAKTALYSTSSGHLVMQVGAESTFTMDLEIVVNDQTYLIKHNIGEKDEQQVCIPDESICVELRMENTYESILKDKYIVLRYKYASDGIATIEKKLIINSVPPLGTTPMVGLGQFQSTTLNNQLLPKDKVKHDSHLTGAPELVGDIGSVRLNHVSRHDFQATSELLSLRTGSPVDVGIVEIITNGSKMDRGSYGHNCYLNIMSPSKEQLDVAQLNMYEINEKFAKYVPELPDTFKITDQGYPDLTEIITKKDRGFVMQGTITAKSIKLSYSDSTGTIKNWNYSRANTVIGGAGSYIEGNIEYYGQGGDKKLVAQEIILLKEYVFLKSGMNKFVVGFKNPMNEYPSLQVCIDGQCKYPEVSTTVTPPIGGTDDPDTGGPSNSAGSYMELWTMLLSDPWIMTILVLMIIVDCFFGAVCVRILVLNFVTVFRGATRRLFSKKMAHLALIMLISPPIGAQQISVPSVEWDLDSTPCVRHTNPRVSEVPRSVVLDAQYAWTDFPRPVAVSGDSQFVLPYTFYADHLIFNLKNKTTVKLNVQAIISLMEIITTCPQSIFMNPQKLSHQMIALYQMAEDVAGRSDYLLTRQISKIVTLDWLKIKTDTLTFQDLLKIDLCSGNKFEETKYYEIYKAQMAVLNTFYKDDSNFQKDYCKTTDQFLYATVPGWLIYSGHGMRADMSRLLGDIKGKVKQGNAPPLSAKCFTAISYTNIKNGVSDYILCYDRETARHYMGNGPRLGYQVQSHTSRTFGKNSKIIVDQYYAYMTNFYSLDNLCLENKPKTATAYRSVSPMETVEVSFIWCIYFCSQGCTHSLDSNNRTESDYNYKQYVSILGDSMKARLTNLPSNPPTKTRVSKALGVAAQNDYLKTIRGTYLFGTLEIVKEMILKKAKGEDTELFFENNIAVTPSGVVDIHIGGFVEYDCYCVLANDLICFNDDSVAFLTKHNRSCDIRTLTTQTGVLKAQPDPIKVPIYPHKEDCSGLMTTFQGSIETCDSDCCHVSTDAWRTSKIVTPKDTLTLSDRSLYQDLFKRRDDMNYYGATPACVAASFGQKWECWKSKWPESFYMLFLFPVIAIISTFLLWVGITCYRSKLRTFGIGKPLTWLKDQSNKMTAYGTGYRYVDRNRKVHNNYQ